jgi:hypothetical protein
MFFSMLTEKTKREDSLDPPFSLLLVLKEQNCPPGFRYCPEVLVAAVAEPADFGVDR